MIKISAGKGRKGKFGTVETFCSGQPLVLRKGVRYKEVSAVKMFIYDKVFYYLNLQIEVNVVLAIVFQLLKNKL